MDERRFSIVFNHLYTASDQTHPKDHDDLNKHHEYIEVNYGILPFLVLPKSSVLNLKIELIAQPMSLRIFLIRLQKIPNFEYRSQPPEPFNSFKKTERSLRLVGVVAPTPRRAIQQIFNHQSSIFNSRLSGSGF